MASMPVEKETWRNKSQLDQSEKLVGESRDFQGTNSSSAHDKSAGHVNKWNAPIRKVFPTLRRKM